MTFLPYHEIKSEQPIEAIWGELLKLADIFYLRKSHPAIQDIGYEYISTSISQAYEYYKASKTISLQTRPLLLYYCFLNLTKAILFIKNNKRPDDSYHGLKRNTVHSLLDYTLKIDGGVFYELIELSQSNLNKNDTITFQDFCNNSIELNEHFARYYEIEPIVIQPRHFYIKDPAYNSTMVILNPHENGFFIYFDKQYADIIKTHAELLKKDFKEYKDEKVSEYHFVIMNETQNRFEVENLIKKYFYTGVFPFKDTNFYLDFFELSSLNPTNDRYYLNMNPKKKELIIF